MGAGGRLRHLPVLRKSVCWHAKHSGHHAHSCETKSEDSQVKVNRPQCSEEPGEDA